MSMYIYIPGTLNNQFLMDGNCETTISQVKVWNHPTEPAILIRGCFGYQVYTVIYIMCMDIYIYIVLINHSNFQMPSEYMVEFTVFFQG